VSSEKFSELFRRFWAVLCGAGSAGGAAAAALNASAGGRIAVQLYPDQLTIPKIMFYEQPLAVGVPKGQSSKIIDQLDAGLAAIRADGT
jgi:ABC-type amino acid transport substrate-binding protein